jgi:hypothetical protein
MLTKEYLREIFNYIDGELFWKVDLATRAKKGFKAGSLGSDGRYFNVQFNKKKYRLHRIIFLWHHGYLPEELDHIDTNKLNNKIENLRPANKSQNQSNTNLSIANTTGVKGVYWSKRDQIWYVNIKLNNKTYYLGSFKEKEQAIETIKRERKKFHKEFARHVSK